MERPLIPRRHNETAPGVTGGNRGVEREKVFNTLMLTYAIRKACNLADSGMLHARAPAESRA